MLKFKKTTYISMLKKEEKTLHAVRSGEQLEKEPSVPEGLWIKCDQCGEMLYKEDVAKNYYVCYKCGKYFRLNAKRRRRLIIDTKTFEEWDTDLQTENPLDYPGYEKKVEELQVRTKIHEAVVTGKGKVNGIDVAIGICDGRFLMGSMGYVVGEKIARAIERATKEKLPVIIFACSGGARMQEGMVSLMQMAKTAAALKKHAEEGLFYLSVLTDPTTGGVTASFAMLGDVILAEPGALVGFAGPRVIEQTIGQKLPKGFQRAEFLVEHGLIDGIVERVNLKETLAQLLKMHEKVPNTKWESLEIKMEHLKGPNVDEGLSMSAWERVQTSRLAKRPTSSEYIHRIFDGFIEMHGDRQFRDDGAIIGGIAYLDGCPVTVIGQQKGKTTKENIVHNFGMPYPEGYRKALRLMKQAEKFKRPIINFVDTPGAFCGLEAEERGQGEAIARNLMEMAGITVPILSIVIGEGGSGGALALAVGNEVWMMENATYSILSPEGFASILWKDSKRANEAAQVMKVTSFDLLHMKIIDKIIPEKQPAYPGNLDDIAVIMKENVKQFLKQFAVMDEVDIVENRYARFRRM